MNKTLETKNYKDFTFELQTIEFVESLDNTDTKIYIKDVFNTNAQISKNNKKPYLEIDNNDSLFQNNEEILNNVKLIINNKEFYIDSLFFDKFETKINENSVSNKTYYSFNILRSKIFTSDFCSTFKCFIPIDQSKLKTFHFQIESIPYIDNKAEYFYDCIRIEINNYEYDLVQLKDIDKGYYVIESKNNIKFNEFSDICFAIRQALGFITGFMPGGEEYYISKEGDFFYTNSFRPAIEGHLYPINSDSYGLLHNKANIAKKFEKTLNVLSVEVFSNLITKINNNPKFSASIILMLEASSIRSLLLIPSVFVVLLEAFDKIISEPENGLDYPIKNINLSKDLIKKLNVIIDTYSEQINSNGLLKIKRRINDLNKPINKSKLTNNEKLTRPFEQLGIKLTEDDIYVIEHRNDLLHGNILISDNMNKNHSEINNNISYVSSKLYTLLSSLILKYVGYIGYIINHAKFNEQRCNIKTEEDYYKFI